MPDSDKIRIWLKVLLYLFAIHSLTAGLLLIILPEDSLAYFGFIITNRFFTTQSGIFHVVMAVCYILAAQKLDSDGILISFIIIAKSIAAIFLLTYYLFIEHILLVIIFGFGDLIMAIVLWIAYTGFKIGNQK